MEDPFKRHRHLFRAWLKRQTLCRENAWYQKRFRERSHVIPNDKGIREGVVKRIPGISPKEKGRLNILALWKNYNWESDALLSQLQSFGDVSLFEWNLESKNFKNDPLLKEKMAGHLLHWIEFEVRERPVDVMFCYISGEQLLPEAVEKIASLGFPVINMYLNDKEYFVGRVEEGVAMGMRDICRNFHLCWTSTNDALVKYVVEGALPVYMPEAANPEIHKAYDEEKSIDVSFVGQCYGDRPEIIEKLKEAGILVEAFGYGWPNGPLSTEEMVRTYSRSRINLGFSGVGAFNEVHCLKGRDFEVPMSGGLYLTGENEELANFFILGEEIVTYSGFDDLVLKIRSLLSDPEKCEMIRRKGYARAQREHSWAERFARVFKLAGVLS